MATATVNHRTEIEGERPEKILGPVSRVYQLQQAAERAQRSYDLTIEALERDPEFRQAMKNPPLGSSGLDHLLNHPAVRDAKVVLDRARGNETEAQEQIGGVVFCAALDNLPKLQQRLDKLNKRAAKINAEPITLTITDERTLLEYTYASDSERGYNAIFEHVYVILKGQAPQIPGFEFIATIQHTEHGNLVRKIPAIAYGVRHNLEFGNSDGEDTPAKRALDSIDLTQYRNADPTCDHCGKIRSRKETFVVYSALDQTTRRVGRTCLRDYTGVDNPERIADYLEFYWEMMRSLGSSRGETKLIPTKDYLTHVATTIRLDGGYRSSKDYDGSTKRGAIDNYWNMVERATDHQGRPIWVDPIDADAVRAAAVLEWVRNWEENSDFAHSVKVAVAGETIPERAHGFAAAAFVAYDKDLMRKAQAEERKTSEWVGQVKERIIFTLTLKRIIWIEDHYSQDGSKPLYIFNDEQGNEVKWFSSRALRIVEEGTYKIKATIKAHEDHPQYGKSTVITRGAIEEIVRERFERTTPRDPVEPIRGESYYADRGEQ